MDLRLLKSARRAGAELSNLKSPRQPKMTGISVAVEDSNVGAKLV